MLLPLVAAVEPADSLAPTRDAITVEETPDAVRIATDALEAAIARRGYVSGVAAGSLVDRQTGFHDPGFGLDIVDWLAEPGSDEAYRAGLPPGIAYEFGNAWHGKRPKRLVEGPQICTQARTLDPQVIRGQGFVAIRTRWRYTVAAPGRKPGSLWEQTVVFPQGKRYFISSDRVTSVNASDCILLRIDMPGHIRHDGGDTFSEVYLSYLGRLPASEFLRDFAPDERYLYRRERGTVPRRLIRAVRLRDPRTGGEGPWLAGMTLDPSAVYEAWCHQRGYVCMIEEIGGRPIRPGDTFGAAFIVGYFDSIEEMNRVYDRYAGATALEVSEKRWRVMRRRGGGGPDTREAAP